MATKRTMSAQNKKRMARNANAMDTLGGFTIIEVVLVLAIAGLIFLMVFIALPQLQRAQRDTQRRNDLGRLEGAITQYQTNNNGKIPAATGTGTLITAVGTDSFNYAGGKFVKNYIVGTNGTPDDFADPSLGPYQFVIGTVPTGEGAVDFTPKFGGDGGSTATIYYFVGARCVDETVTSAPGARQYALVYKLEGSGVYCQDNAG